jgi:hypothetical protein
MSFIAGMGLGALLVIGASFIFAADANNPDDIDDFTDFR